MKNFTGQYWPFKAPNAQLSYTGSYEVGEVITWTATVYRVSTVVGRPSGHISLKGLTPEQHETAVHIAISAVLDNGGVSVRGG